jgi:hypothetical protein
VAEKLLTGWRINGKELTFKELFQVFMTFKNLIMYAYTVDNVFKTQARFSTA